ncbi:hypothetical protein KSW81_002816 [Nannochloris sp. 'desiccata']|nr:hypothetical protein KSW81_002816 [Chlorella desiccata (nom. nud.)]
MSGLRPGAPPVSDGSVRASVKVASIRKPNASPPAPSKAACTSFWLNYSSRQDKSIKVYEQIKKASPTQLSQRHSSKLQLMRSGEFLPTMKRCLHLFLT